MVTEWYVHDDPERYRASALDPEAVDESIDQVLCA